MFEIFCFVLGLRFLKFCIFKFFVFNCILSSRKRIVFGRCWWFSFMLLLGGELREGFSCGFFILYYLGLVSVFIVGWVIVF